MTSYEMHGPVLVIRIAGPSTPGERDTIFEAIRTDPSVPDRSLLLVDAFGLATPPATYDEIVARVARLVDLLGPKIGAACAAVFRPDAQWTGRQFQRIAARHDVRVGLFEDEPSAWRWLQGYVRRERHSGVDDGDA
jgi:hypothetical protein